MKKFIIWSSTDSWADFLIDHTVLKNCNIQKKRLYESDANNPKSFHRMPDHIKKILYLDAPDLILECDGEPILCIEDSREAGTGHNAFQRFCRIAASVENRVPCLYIYPEAVQVNRANNKITWDRINPLIFKTLIKLSELFRIPAIFIFFPTKFSTNDKMICTKVHKDKGVLLNTNYNYAGCPAIDKNIEKVFKITNQIVNDCGSSNPVIVRERVIDYKIIQDEIKFMKSFYIAQSSGNIESPLTATIEVDTLKIINYIKKFKNLDKESCELLLKRERSIIYKVDAAFRGDPYCGALAAIDYLECRNGGTYEDRKKNLVLCWGSITELENEIKIFSRKASVNDYFEDVKKSLSKNILDQNYVNLNANQTSRFYMQVRYGSTYSKAKHIRSFSFFADAILFKDGVIWRDM